jgi:D-glycero-D-manno-heptose 1,7-bisphosphate phosphatase
MTRAAAFVDRDGTINERPPPHQYVARAEDFRWLPGAQEGLVRLAAAGLRLVVVSNQRGIARGLVSWETIHGIEAEIQDRLGSQGVAVESFRYCPHELAADCPCRKPRPGMLLDAARDLGLDLPSSWMIGDSASDVEAGRAAGCLTALVGPAAAAAVADLLAPTLLQVSEGVAARCSAAAAS